MSNFDWDNPEEVQKLLDFCWRSLSHGLKEVIESYASKPISEGGICGFFFACLDHLPLDEKSYDHDNFDKVRHASMFLAGGLLLNQRDIEAAYVFFYYTFVGETMASGPSYIQSFFDEAMYSPDGNPLPHLRRLCHTFFQIHGALIITETRGHMLHAVHKWTQGNPTLGSLRDKLVDTAKDGVGSRKVLHDFSVEILASVDDPHPGTWLTVFIQSTDGTRHQISQQHNCVQLCWVLLRYSAEMGLSKKHRCIHRGKTLFLSDSGKKTLKELGIVSGDIIKVGGEESKPAVSSVAKEAKPKGKSKKKLRQAAKRKKRTTKPSQPSEPTEKELRERHSKAMQPVLDELSPQLKSIRDRLSILAIKKTAPKNRGLTNVTNTRIIEPAPRLPDESLGKAGKVCYSVLVGEEANLYRTHKPHSSSKRLHIDLHGCPRAEALNKLNEALPQWVDRAMHGEHPFVVPVDIICGGGCQILSETVRDWIKRTRQVANRPKRY